VDSFVVFSFFSLLFTCCHWISGSFYLPCANSLSQVHHCPQPLCPSYLDQLQGHACAPIYTVHLFIESYIICI
jgi:hypothetical protein